MAEALKPTGTVYGIKLADTEYESGRKKIYAITRFKSGNVLEDFDEITEANYNKWAPTLTPFHYWDVAAEEPKKDAAAETAFNDSAEISALRKRLKTLFYEIQFTAELEESTTALQAEYDALLEDYEELLNPEA
jgi:hypothetical protein